MTQDPTKSPAVSERAFQDRVQPWLLACFGEIIAGDREERNHRFLEEALELVQACGCSENEAHQLVDYVYGRPIGEPAQEVGGVMVTLAALCLANGLDMHTDGETELARIWTKVEAIRAKQAAKPKHSPLPEGRLAPAPEKGVRDKAIAAMRAYVTSAGVPETEFDPDFVVRMMAAMMVSFHKYGLVAKAYPLKFNAADDVRARMAKYRQTGNKHYLVDAANFAMIEAMHPGRASEWGENDAADSPGRTTASGHRLVHETNEGERLTAQERGL